MQRQSLIIFHSQINTKLVPKQNMANRNKSPLFPFYFRARCYMAWNISLVNSGSPPGHIPSQLPAYPPAYVLEEQGEKQTRPQCCANTVQQQLKHQHVNSIVLVTHIEHRTMWAAIRDTDSIPDSAAQVSLSSAKGEPTAYGKCFISVCDTAAKTHFRVPWAGEDNLTLLRVLLTLPANFFFPHIQLCCPPCGGRMYSCQGFADFTVYYRLKMD